MPPFKPRILFIDAYDSFSNNIISLLETELDCVVYGVKIDNPILLSSEAALCEELSHYDAVVCGPGPGHPQKKEDVGIMRKIWRLDPGTVPPVLGICLGFQSLCLEFGGEVKRLKGPQHGMTRRITHVGEVIDRGEKTIFRGIGEIKATLYQSLCADIGQDELSREAYELKRWLPTEKCPNLIPLAWAESNGAEKDSGVMDDRVLVAVRHIIRPFWALQYHPESICTNAESRKVILNWFQEAQIWNYDHRKSQVNSETPAHGQITARDSLLHKYENTRNESIHELRHEEQLLGNSLESIYQSRIINLPEYISVPDVVEAIQDPGSDQIVLESSNAHERSTGSADVRGRYSIIGLDIENTLRFEYRTGQPFITATSHAQPRQRIDLLQTKDVWSFLARFLDSKRISGGNADSPFWGGFMGYTTYEMGLEGIAVRSRTRSSSSRPDLCFAWVTRSLVIDHEKNLIYLQDLGQIQGWMETVSQKIAALSLPATNFYHPPVSSSHPLMASASSSQTSLNISPSDSQFPTPVSSKNSEYSHETPKTHLDSSTSISTPLGEEYESKVRVCQNNIRAGDSYELCLTDQTTVRRQRFDLQSKSTSLSQNKQPNPGPDAWHLYRTLRARQPAPFGSFIRLGSATLISSSPERFLTYSRTGRCELRPMKGTVRKSPTVPTLRDAIPLLDIPKEKAENLMIVDLVRHDLFSICGSGNVQVPQLMVVEEYRSVFQMISVVEGQIPSKGKYTGLDVLAASLPPGSMTGAPKKRSCEILQDIEEKERSLYSGVVGYMDVGGRGDWSVNIRCMFRWDDEDEVFDGKRMESWHIGAGGAVTVLSTPEGEREEMGVKLNGTLGVFR